MHLLIFVLSTASGISIIALFQNYLCYKISFHYFGTVGQGHGQLVLLC